jgi:hypothetical protein
VTFHGIGVETLCFVALLVCGLCAFLAWLVGMVRPKGFGAWPAALWIGLRSRCCVLGLLDFLSSFVKNVSARPALVHNVAQDLRLGCMYGLLS